MVSPSVENSGAAQADPQPAENRETPLVQSSVVATKAMPSAQAVLGQLDDLSNIRLLAPETVGNVAAQADLKTRATVRAVSKNDAVGASLRDGAERAIRALKITNRDDLPRALEVFQKGQSIDTVTLQGSSFTDDDLRRLPITLKTLTLTDSPRLTTAGLEHLITLDLSSLTVSNSDIGNAGAAVIARIGTLKSLDLSNNDISDAGAIAVAGNPGLTGLVMRANRIGFPGALAIAQSTSLSSVSLRGNRIGDAGAQALARNAAIIKLDISVNDLSEAVKQQLAMQATERSIDYTM
jgi:hypothetical protein